MPRPINMPLTTPPHHAPHSSGESRHSLGPVPLDFSEDSSQGLRLTSLM